MNGKYEIIETIKESERVSVHLAAVDGIAGPVIVKEVRNADVSVYRSLKDCKNVHFPKIFDIWTEDTTPESRQNVTIVEEYVDGETLAVCVKEGLYSKRELLGFMLQLCDALEVIHTMVPPLIHRDIKPSNILINKEGVLKLIDFDASRRYKRDERTTSDTILLGTAEYAAPEQFGYQQTNEQSDIYSFGVLLADMFEIRIREEAHKKHDDSGDFSKKSRRMKRIESIIAKCTQFDPGRRYEKISEVKKDLSAVLEGKPSKKLIAIFAAATLILAGGITALILCTHSFTDNNSDRNQEPVEEISRSEFTEITFTGGGSIEDVRWTYLEYTTVEDLIGKGEAPDYLTQEYVTKLQTMESVLLNNYRFVVHFYPQLEPKKDLNYRNGWFDTRGAKVVGITLTDLMTQTDMVLTEDEWYTSEHIIFIRREALLGLKEGFYEIKTDIEIPGKKIRDLLTLNINAVETDPAKMLVCPFDCLCFDPAQVDYTSFAVPHNEDKRIMSLVRDNDNSPVDETLYQITEDGIIISIDSAEFKSAPGQDAFYYNVLYEDGSSWPVTVYAG